MFIDKRGNQLDLLSVNETAFKQPNVEDPDIFNSQARLQLEATAINQNFSQQVLKRGEHVERREMDHPNPFFDEEDEPEDAVPESVAYRYRKWNVR